MRRCDNLTKPREHFLCCHFVQHCPRSTSSLSVLYVRLALMAHLHQIHHCALLCSPLFLSRSTFSSRFRASWCCACRTDQRQAGGKSRPPRSSMCNHRCALCRCVLQMCSFAENFQELRMRCTTLVVLFSISHARRECNLCDYILHGVCSHAASTRPKALKRGCPVLVVVFFTMSHSFQSKSSVSS